MAKQIKNSAISSPARAKRHYPRVSIDLKIDQQVSAAISRFADRLTAKALTARTPDPSDARERARAITAWRRSLVPKLTTLADENGAEFLSHLSAEERSMVKRVLNDIVRIRSLESIPVD